MGTDRVLERDHDRCVCRGGNRAEVDRRPLCRRPRGGAACHVRLAKPAGLRRWRAGQRRRAGRAMVVDDVAAYRQSAPAVFQRLFPLPLGAGDTGDRHTIPPRRRPARVAVPAVLGGPAKPARSRTAGPRPALVARLGRLSGRIGARGLASGGPRRACAWAAGVLDRCLRRLGSALLDPALCRDAGSVGRHPPGAGPDAARAPRPYRAGGVYRACGVGHPLPRLEPCFRPARGGRAPARLLRQYSGPFARSRPDGLYRCLRSRPRSGLSDSTPTWYGRATVRCWRGRRQRRWRAILDRSGAWKRPPTSPGKPIAP